MTPGSAPAQTAWQETDASTWPGMLVTLAEARVQKSPGRIGIFSDEAPTADGRAGVRTPS
jgi:hypothetical protein